MSKILCLDPGGTTGAALIEYTDDSVSVLESFQIQGGLTGFISWHNNTELDWDLVVCESFTLRPGVHGVDLSPTYIIGALEALSEQKKSIVYQEPKLKPLCDDARLKVMEMHTPGKGHANDAVRHGIIYLRAMKHLPTLKKGWA